MRSGNGARRAAAYWVACTVCAAIVAGCPLLWTKIYTLWCDAIGLNAKTAAYASGWVVWSYVWYPLPGALLTALLQATAVFAVPRFFGVIPENAGASRIPEGALSGAVLLGLLYAFLLVTGCVRFAPAEGVGAAAWSFTLMTYALRAYAAAALTGGLGLGWVRGGSSEPWLRALKTLPVLLFDVLLTCGTPDAPAGLISALLLSAIVLLISARGSYLSGAALRFVWTWAPAALLGSGGAAGLFGLVSYPAAYDFLSGGANAPLGGWAAALLTAAALGAYLLIIRKKGGKRDVRTAQVSAAGGEDHGISVQQ